MYHKGPLDLEFRSKFFPKDCPDLLITRGVQIIACMIYKPLRAAKVSAIFTDSLGTTLTKVCAERAVHVSSLAFMQVSPKLIVNEGTLIGLHMPPLFY